MTRARRRQASIESNPVFDPAKAERSLFFASRFLFVRFRFQRRRSGSICRQLPCMHLRDLRRQLLLQKYQQLGDGIGVNWRADGRLRSHLRGQLMDVVRQRQSMRKYQ